MRALLALAMGVACCAPSLTQAEPTRTEKIHEVAAFIMSHIYPAVPELCRPLFEGVLTAFSLDATASDEKILNNTLREQGCLDKFSIIARPPPGTTFTLAEIPAHVDNIFRFLQTDWRSFEKKETVPLGWTLLPKVNKPPYYRGYAYLGISSFLELESMNRFETDVQYILAHPPQGIILDLRKNGGGWVSFAEEVMDLFAPEDGRVGLTGRDQNGVEAPLYTAHARGTFADLPVAILMDHDTASASEMVASVLKCWHPDTVVLIGSQSYGKGIIQNTFRDWEAGLGVDVKITTKEYYPGDDDSVKIQGVGLKPDVEDTSPTLGFEAIDHAIAVLDQIRQK